MDVPGSRVTTPPASPRSHPRHPPPADKLRPPPGHRLPRHPRHASEPPRLARDQCVGLTDINSFDFDYTRRDTPARPSWRLSRSLSCLSTPVGSISKYVNNIYYTFILSIRLHSGTVRRLVGVCGLLVAGLHSADKQIYIHCGCGAAQLSFDPKQLWAQL